MVEIWVNGEPLTLDADTEVDIEYTSTLLSEALGDSFSLSFTAPVRGNERLLGSTHVYGRRRRPLKFPVAEMREDGSRLFPGILYVDGSNEENGTISLSFAVDGFISSLDDQSLRDINMGKTVHVKNMPLHAKVTNTKFWPQVAYVFPMIKAADLFTTQENAAWSPSTTDWSDDSTYAINDLVTHEGDTGAVARKETYQATGSVAAGMPPPPIFTASWRRTAFGIVNQWNPDTQTFYVNDESGNFYALVPLYFTKEIVKRGLAFYGYGVEGEWWDDERHHQLIMWNNRTLDDRTTSSFFRASQTDPVSGLSPLVIPLANDSTAPNEDVDGVWDPVNHVFTSPSNANCHFTLHYEIELSDPAAVRIEAMPVGGMIPLWTFQHFISISGFTHTLDFTIPLPENTAIQVRITSDAPVTITVHDAWMKGWSETTSMLNTYGNEITPAEHMPALSLKELLQSLRDVFGLRIRPSADGRTIRMDYMQSLLLAATVPEDMTPAVRGPLTLQHTDRTDGFRLRWGHSLPDLPDLAKIELLGPFVDERMLSVPSHPRMYAVVLDTRRVYIPRVFNDTDLRWVPQGWLLPDGVVGTVDDEDGVRSTEPAISPMLMEDVWVRGRRFVIPTTDDHGNSPYFRTANNLPAPLFTYWRGMVYNTNIIACEGGFVLYNASYGPVNGLYCPDGTYNGHPRWTKSGGTTMADSIYYYDGETFGDMWHLTSGGTVLDSPTNVRYVSTTVTDDPASLVWTPFFWTPEPSPLYEALPTTTPVLYPCASSFEHGMAGEAPAWETSLDWSSDRGPLALHQRSLLEALTGAEVVETDLEVTPGMLTAQDYERGRMLKGQRCFILTLPVKHGTGKGRLIAENTRLLKLRNP